MLSSETVEQFVKDIHGEEGKDVLLIFADYLEENGIDWGLRRRRVRNVGISYVYGIGYDLGNGCSYSYGGNIDFFYSGGSGSGCGYGNAGVYSLGYARGSGLGMGDGYASPFPQS